jgi:hypothetical protein
MKHTFIALLALCLCVAGCGKKKPDTQNNHPRPTLKAPKDELTKVTPLNAQPVEMFASPTLGWDDRLLGSMLLAAEAGVVPSRLARGASIALGILCQEKGRDDPSVLLDELWESEQGDHRQEFQQLILSC